MHASIDVGAVNVAPDRLRLVDRVKVDELAESMRERGQLNPIIVRCETSSPRFRLVAGEHRLEAARLLGWTKVDATVRIADDTELAALEDEIDEIDENVRRAEMTPGEIKLATKKRKTLFVRRAALIREQEALDAHNAVLEKAAEATRAEKRRARDAKRAAKQALAGARAPDAHARVNAAHPVNRKAAAAFVKETADRHGVTRDAVERRVREADEIEALADWAKVDPRDIARSSIQAGRQLAAALEIASRYGKGVVVEAGNVHLLLKRHVRRAAKGHAIDIVAFKTAIDKELRADELKAKRDSDETERYRHLASMLSKAAKAVLDAQDLATAYRKQKTAERLDQIKRELRTMSDGMSVGVKGGVTH